LQWLRWKKMEEERRSDTAHVEMANRNVFDSVKSKDVEIGYG
jgi:hypothetical protein